MQQLIILKGLPGSGKSTYAREWVNQNPSKRIIVNRDSLRRSFGPYWVPEREDFITSIERESVREALKMGFSVIVDATNFKAEWIEMIYKNLSKFIPDLKLVYEDFTHVSLEECIARDAYRERDEQVGESVIRKFYDKYIKK